jgi:predicted transcriptional regulator
MMRRTSLDVYVDILEAAQNGANKTRIVYRANLNFEIVKKYLKSLIESDLLMVNENGKYYTTKKGYNFIIQYRNLIQPLDFSLLTIKN